MWACAIRHYAIARHAGCDASVEGVVQRQIDGAVLGEMVIEAEIHQERIAEIAAVGREGLLTMTDLAQAS